MAGARPAHHEPIRPPRRGGPLRGGSCERPRRLHDFGRPFRRSRLFGNEWRLRESRDPAARRGIRDVYAHLAQRYVRIGQLVRAGDPIGRMGQTGNATGVHLHFEVRYQKTPQNPLAFLP
ncbi:MAG: M23 family metallopeptidase [Brockia lithotrophica]|nr:M23 family metallopeptidase [Brockia lithotrophica]